jgi:hypothetical protein
MNIIKQVSYAYATSDMARWLGHHKTGCWYVTVGESGTKHTFPVEHASTDKQAVLDVAGMLPYAWGVWSMHE